MKRIFVLLCVLALLFGACGVQPEPEAEETEITLNDEIILEAIKSGQFGYYGIIGPTRPVPEEAPPEIEHNKELLLNLVPIDEDTALRYAEYLYHFYVPELAEATVEINEEYGFHRIRAVGTDSAIYHFTAFFFHDFAHIANITRETEDGEEVLFK